MQDDSIIRFHWEDYVVFVVSLLISAFIGVYFGFAGKKQKTTKDFLVGGKQMSAFPVAMSIVASFTSAPAILGNPTEIYYFGTIYLWCILGFFSAGLVAAHLLVPVFHKMQVTSAYEYLGHRYSREVRWLGSITFALMMILYMGASIYAPAIAFSQVTGLSMYMSVLGVGVICTFYTSVGGMKAVIWTDVLQMSIIILGVMVLVILGGLEVGSLSEIANIVNDGGRWHWFEFSPDPRIRYSFWTQFVGVGFMTTGLLGSNQAMIQRYLSIRSSKDAQKSIYFAVLIISIFTILNTLLGCIMYAFYHTCDPIASKQVDRLDQIVPYFIMQIFGPFHGLPGLFSAAVFSATLSTVSSGLNALSAVFLVDFVHPFYYWKTKTCLRENVATIISKVVAAVIGLLTIGIAYLTPYLGNTLTQITQSIFGMIGGPMLGVFSLAIFVPWSNTWGAVAGMLSGLVFSFWLTIGSVVNRVPLKTLPIRIDGCTGGFPAEENVTIRSYTVSMQTSMVNLDSSTPLQEFISDDGYNIYETSYLWYSMYAVLTTLIMGCLFSAITGCNNGKRQPINLVYDYAGHCRCCCQGRCLNFCLGKTPMDKGEKYVASDHPEKNKDKVESLQNDNAFYNYGYDDIEGTVLQNFEEGTMEDKPKSKNLIVVKF